MVKITTVDLLGLATSIPYANQITSLTTATPDAVHFLSYNETFVSDVLGANVSETLIATTSWQAFHEAGVYNQATNSLYISSNWAKNFSNPINITVLNLDDNSFSSTRYPNLSEANGGTAYYPPGTPVNSSAGQQMVFCDQGDLVNPSQLVVIDPSTNSSRPILTSFMGQNFSSINDIKQHPKTGDLWFTDVPYAYWQFFRPAPVIRPQVYRFEPNTGVVQAVADGFVAPNGLEISPDLKSVYVTDTGFNQYANASTDSSKPSSIYKFDISPDGKGLQNRRLFAYAEGGIPDGIHTDIKGNVYSGCPDGVSVWNKEGVLLGKMLVAGGVNNFAFVPGGMFIFSNDKLFKVTLAAVGRMVRKDFGPAL